MVIVQTEAFDPGALSALLQSRNAGKAGAMVQFLGMVRDFNPDTSSQSLFLEHYPGMCESEIGSICDQARSRWDILDTLVVHRVGELPLADPIVFVGVAGVHRGQTFLACEYIIDALKTRAPFWKRETLADGRRFWVEQQAADAHKTAQWEQSSTSSENPDPKN